MIAKIFNKIKSILGGIVTEIKWSLGMRSVPVPNDVKVRNLKKIAEHYKLNYLIESGTYYGRTPYLLRKHFKKIISIEIDETLHNNAKKQLAKYPNIQLEHGDSGAVLDSVLSNIAEPVLFWLDGHYSGGETGKGSEVTPIFQELQAIFKRSQEDIILIDDARIFINESFDYPSIGKVIDFVKNYRPDAYIEVADDSIRVLPKKA